MKRDLFTCAAILLAFATFTLSTGAVPAVVLTNTGRVADGSLVGLAPILRLNRPADMPFVGPDMQFDVPLSSIKQITLDFPRVIVETATRTLIGPYSAFAGIAEILSLDIGSETLKLATTALRAIALNGSSLRSVPREWMPNEFLDEPGVLPSSALTGSACDDCSIDIPVIQVRDDGDVPIWNTITPTILPADPAPAIPWWVGLLGVAGLVGLFYLLSTSKS